MVTNRSPFLSPPYQATLRPTLLPTQGLGLAALPADSFSRRVLPLLPTPPMKPEAKQNLLATSSAEAPSFLPAGKNWELVFHDEFKGTDLNRKQWTTHYDESIGYGTNKGNAEEQWYTPDAFALKNGVLSIEAKPEVAKAGYPYKSGIITTQNSFATTYGYFEIRCQVPKGQGLWPAFWLLPSSCGWPPELDVMEVLGHETDKLYCTNHYKTPEKPHLSQLSAIQGSEDFANGFHTIGMLWEPDKLVWYVDGKEQVRHTEHIPQEPMYMLANLAIGGQWAGSPDKTTVFPAQFDIDYIRAYKEKPTSNPNCS